MRAGCSSATNMWLRRATATVVLGVLAVTLLALARQMGTEVVAYARAPDSRLVHATVRGIEERVALTGRATLTLALEHVDDEYTCTHRLTVTRSLDDAHALYRALLVRRARVTCRCAVDEPCACACDDPGRPPERIYRFAVLAPFLGVAGLLVACAAAR